MLDDKALDEFEESYLEDSAQNISLDGSQGQTQDIEMAFPPRSVSALDTANDKTLGNPSINIDRSTTMLTAPKNSSFNNVLTAFDNSTSALATPKGADRNRVFNIQNTTPKPTLEKPAHDSLQDLEDELDNFREQDKKSMVSPRHQRQDSTKKILDAVDFSMDD